MNLNAENRTGQTGADAPKLCSTRFCVYENQVYIGESVFDKKRILIGKSRDADLVLDSQSIADIHALVELKKGQAILFNKNIGNGLRLNGLSIKESLLRAEDVIELGPYSIVFKENEAQYSIILLNNYPSKQSWQNAIESFAALFKTNPEKVAKFFERPQLVLKSKISRQSALRTKAALEKAGVLCCVVAEGDSIPVIDDPSISISALTQSVAQSDDDKTEASNHEDEKDHDSFTALDSGPEPGQADDIMLSAMESGIYYDEDEDEDPWEAPFNLQEVLLAYAGETVSFQKRPLQVQVIKSIGQRIIDTRFVTNGDKYVVNKKSGRCRLVESKSKGDVFVYFETGMDGYLEEPGRSRAAIDTLCREENLHSRRKQIYRIVLPQKGGMVLYHEHCRYDISMTEAMPSPAVQVPAREKTLKWRHWGYSSALHLFCIIVLSIYAYMTGVNSVEQKPHFVKVDMSMLQAMEAKKEIKPPPTTKKEPPPEPEPVKVAEKLEKPTKKQPPKKVAQASRNTKKSARHAANASQTSRHPNAGGGFGEGNIKNRNVNQTGLLSILGSNAVPGPATAIASVTNIDAVKVPGASEKNFTVGGIKGSLGTGKISVGTSGGVVTTKGSKQVLRSAGASGPGTVAALEKGTTGQKSVKGMVTAKMSRSVKIEGGMSREMVKRVIDQHLSEITYCYESALVGNPSISGRVIFEWKILMNGRVGEIRIVASSINSHQIHDCIKGAIKSWQFPKPAGTEVVVSYPFIFDLVAF